jgi:hypothetical protein
MNAYYSAPLLLIFLLPHLLEAAQSDGQSHIELIFPPPRAFNTNTTTGQLVTDHTTAPCGDYNLINETARVKFPVSGAPIAIDAYGNFSSPNPDSFSSEMSIGLFNATTSTQRDDVWYPLSLGHEWQMTGANSEQLWCSYNVSPRNDFVLGAAHDYLQKPVSDTDLDGLTATFQWILRSQFANGTKNSQYRVRLSYYF